ncbi:MAG: MFS transporter [Pseudomonadota bacterium]
MNDPKAARAALMRDASFRWLMSGGVISMLGDQFTMIALPWLVLKMTHDPLALGMVIAISSIPRAIFILIGGALVDRYSPRTVLMLTKYANAALVGTLATLVLTHSATLPLIYLIALGIGLASAFSIPSGSSIVPRVVSLDQLQLANGTLMGMRQMTSLAGPLLAAALFAVAGDEKGLGYAFAFDCFSYLFSAWTLAQVRTHDVPKPASAEPVLRAVGAGIKMVWDDVQLRTVLLYWAICGFVVGGSIQVALPLLASERLHGASALGMLMGAHGIGTLVGMALSGIKGNLRLRNLGTTLLAIDFTAGFLLVPLGAVQATWQGMLVLLVMGTVAGFMQVAVFSWIQRRVPQAMLGRAMSIFMFIFMGVAPLSAAITGAIMQVLTLTQLFLFAGMFLSGVAAVAFVVTPIRAIEDVKA